MALIPGWNEAEFTAFFAFIFGALSAYDDWRIWTRRASRLTLPIIF